MSDDATASRRVRVDYEGGDRFSIAVRQHTISVDQPASDGGEDTAPTPTELFVASLASCVAFYARRFAARHGIPTEGLAVVADFSMASHPARVGGITLRLHVPEELAPEQQEALLAVASHCTVHGTLVQPPEVRIEMAALTAGAV
ncbi:MAG: OsmC family protein [Candidatus Dormibacteria bacterium]